MAIDTNDTPVWLITGCSTGLARTRIADYEESAGKRQDSTKHLSGSQAGDPDRAAEGMIALSQMAAPPRHLPLGNWGYDVVMSDRKERLEQVDHVRAMSMAADFPGG